MPTPTYLVVTCINDHRFVQHLVEDLVRRNLTVHWWVVGGSSRTAADLASYDAVLLFARQDGLEDPFGWLPVGTDMSNVTLVVSKHALTSRTWAIPPGPRAVIAQGDRNDMLLREMILAKGPPPPPWLDCRVHRTLVKPTGVAWWNDDLLAADVARECVVQLDGGGGAIDALTGIGEPYHIGLDRRRVFVTDVSENRIMTAEVRPGLGFTHIDDLSVPADEIGGVGLAKAHGVWASEGLLAIADTDNQRVLLRYNRQAPYRWEVFTGPEPFNYPCGVMFFGTELWVTNSDVGIVDVFDLLGERAPWRYAPGLDVLVDPNATVRWKDLVFITDEVGQTLLGGRCSLDGATPELDLDAVASQWICAPWGMSVNATSRLAVADRLLGVVWLIDIPAWYATLDGGSSG